MNSILRIVTVSALAALALALPGLAAACTAGAKTSCSARGGTGTRICGKSGTWGLCLLTSCDSGYTLYKQTCDASQQPCTVANGTGVQYFSGGSYGACQVASCDLGYQLSNGACVTPPTLADLWSGGAHFQSDAESQVVSMSFNVAPPSWDQWRLPMLQDPSDPSGQTWYGYTREWNELGTGTIALMRSTDGGQAFTEVGDLFAPPAGLACYDADVEYDPFDDFYYMLMECNASNTSDPQFPAPMQWASTYVSYSQNPFELGGWTEPTPLILGCNGNPSAGCSATVSESASTPMLLVDDGGMGYVGWSVVQGQIGLPPSEQNVFTVGGSWPASSPIWANENSLLMGAEQQAGCTDWWDCDNRNGMSWKVEDGWYYLFYAGANFPNCDATDGNEWGISVARSATPLGGYGQLPGGPIMYAPSSGGCNIGYPMMNTINGAIYLYYTEPNLEKRSELVWN